MLSQKRESMAPGEDAWESMWTHFGACISGDAEPLTSGPEGRASLEFVEAIYRSIETGAAVKLPL